MPDKITQQVELLKRGTVEVLREDELARKLTEAADQGRQLRIKLGLDPTSPDIHLGHTVQLRKVRQFQDLGHKVVLIIGDYTARIGDPSGQDKTRPVLDGDQIDSNAKTYFDQAGTVLDTSEEKLEVRYNSEWLQGLNFADILKLASSMTVARMLERDNFERRYKGGEPIGVHEFLYPLMQGYDSVMINADVEAGGTDQTFNLLVGRDMQRLYGQQEQVVMVQPILVGLDGTEKMSKSKGNYVGVTDKPSDMFGKIMSISDEMMENYYTLLTSIGAEKITELIDPAKTHPKEAKVSLAKDVVTQFHSADAADAAEAEFEKIFAQNLIPEDMPIVDISDEQITVSKLLVHCELVATGGEAKRMIKQGGVRINEDRASDPNLQITPDDGMVVRVGKRKFAKLKLK